MWDMTNNQCKPVPIAEDETPPTWDIGLFTLTADKKYVDVKEGGKVTITVSDILDSRILCPEMGVSSEAPINNATNFGQLRVRNISGVAPMEIDNFMIKVIE